MVTSLLFVLSLAPAAEPVPLPDRWLLKLMPAELAAMPERFYETIWYDDFPSRSVRLSFQLWAEFHKAKPGAAAEAVLTLTGGFEDSPPTGWKLGMRHKQPLTPPGRTSFPLAVHGPLVEFNGRLFTASFGTLKRGRKDTEPEPVLHLGSAVGLKNHLWYQAGTRTGTDDKTIVEEWRLEFQNDPQTMAEGMVTVQSHTRLLTEAKGESFKTEVRYKAEPSNDRTHARVVTFDKSNSKLPYMVFGNERGMATMIWRHDLDRVTLTKAPEKVPKPATASRGLVQPPMPKK